jgi:hypothetical protein
MMERHGPPIYRERRIAKAAEMPFCVVHVLATWTRVHLPMKRICTLAPLGFRVDGSEAQPSDLIVLARDAAEMEALPQWRQAAEARAVGQAPSGIWSRFFKGSSSGAVELSAALLHEGARVMLWPATREPLVFFSGDCSVVGEQSPHVDLISIGAPQVAQIVCVPR